MDTYAKPSLIRDVVPRTSYRSIDIMHREPIGALASRWGAGHTDDRSLDRYRAYRPLTRPTSRQDYTRIGPLMAYQSRDERSLFAYVNAATLGASAAVSHSAGRVYQSAVQTIAETSLPAIELTPKYYDADKGLVTDWHTPAIKGSVRYGIPAILVLLAVMLLSFISFNPSGMSSTIRHHKTTAAVATSPGDTTAPVVTTPSGWAAPMESTPNESSVAWNGTMPAAQTAVAMDMPTNTPAGGYGGGGDTDTQSTTPSSASTSGDTAWDTTSATGMVTVPGQSGQTGNSTATGSSDMSNGTNTGTSVSIPGATVNTGITPSISTPPVTVHTGPLL